MLISTRAMTFKTGSIERGMKAGSSLETCRRDANGSSWVLEKVLELPGATDEISLSDERCPKSLLMLQPRQRIQVGMSTGAGDGLVSAVRPTFFCGCREPLRHATEAADGHVAIAD